MEEETIEVVKNEEPKYAIDLYMRNRGFISKAKNSSERYWIIIENISIGISMLNEHKELKESVKKLLENRKTYPSPRNMEFDDVSKVYSLNIEGGQTGKVQVLQEQLEIGQKEIHNQQAESLMNIVKEWDNKIYESLIEEGIIQKYSISDMFQKVLKGEIDGIST